MAPSLALHIPEVYPAQSGMNFNNKYSSSMQTDICWKYIYNKLLLHLLDFHILFSMFSWNFHNYVHNYVGLSIWSIYTKASNAFLMIGLKLQTHEIIWFLLTIQETKI